MNFSDINDDFIAQILEEQRLILNDATIHDDAFQRLYSGIHFKPYMEKWLEQKLEEAYEKGWKDGQESLEAETLKDDGTVEI